MKTPVVNQQTCIGCGTCPALCSATFALQADGKAYVTNPTGNTEAEIQGAIDACPVEAISWSQE